MEGMAAESEYMNEMMNNFGLDVDDPDVDEEFRALEN